MADRQRLALTNYNGIIAPRTPIVKEQTAAGYQIIPAAVCYFLFGFLGNHPCSTRLARSFNARMLHRQPVPKSPRRMDKSPWINRRGAYKNIFQVQFHGSRLTVIVALFSNISACLLRAAPPSPLDTHFMCGCAFLRNAICGLRPCRRCCSRRPCRYERGPWSCSRNRPAGRA